MTEDLATELEDLTVLAREFFTKEVAPRHEEFAAAGEPDRALYRRAGELGLLLMSIPSEYGGGGATITEMSTAVRALAYHCSATALVMAMHQIEVWYLMRHGHTDELRALLAVSGVRVLLPVRGDIRAGGFGLVG